MVALYSVVISVEPSTRCLQGPLVFVLDMDMRQFRTIASVEKNR